MYILPANWKNEVLLDSTTNQFPILLPVHLPSRCSLFACLLSTRMTSVVSRASGQHQQSLINHHPHPWSLKNPTSTTIATNSPTVYYRILSGASAFVLFIVALVAYSIASTGHTASTTKIMSTTADSSTPTTTAFSLLVTLTFAAPEHKATFLADFAPLAQYVQDSERATTTSYTVLYSDQDPLRVLILERYMDKESAFLQIHKTSAAFLEFRPKLKALETAGFVTIQGESFLDSGVGFVDG